MLYLALLLTALVALPTTTCPSDKSISIHQNVIDNKQYSKQECLTAARVIECKTVASKLYPGDGDWCGAYADCMATIEPEKVQLSVYCY